MRVIVRRLAAIALFGAACGTTSPVSVADAEPDVAPPLDEMLVATHVEFHPTGTVVYKLQDDLGFENWNLGIALTQPPGLPKIEALRIHHRAAGQRRHTVELDATAMSKFVDPSARAPGTVRLQHLHFSLPAELAIDEVEVEVRAAGKTTGRATANLRVYEQRGKYRLPMRGCWFVSSGHDFGNEHRRHLGQGHFAWDFVRVDWNGQTASGPALDDSYAYAQTIVAVANGTVVAARDDLPDSAPGRGRGEANFVEIDHGNGEISRVLHLRPGSLRVRAGERVWVGQPIAEVGNSGDSDTPHLHIGFRRDSESVHPIPVRFSDYTMRWNQGTQRLDSGRPRRGQFVCAD